MIEAYVNYLYNLAEFAQSHPMLTTASFAVSVVCGVGILSWTLWTIYVLVKSYKAKE